MAQGRFQKRKKKANPVPIICITAVIVAACFIGTALLLDARSDPAETVPSTPGDLRPGDTAPGTTAAPIVPVVPTTDATTVPTTEATTAPTEETTVPTTEATVPEATTLGDRVAALALAQVGKPYSLGGTGPDSFDTSGLVYYCFRENGHSVSRVISGQVEHGTPVQKEDLLPGDVVFFWTENEGQAEYVGIYVGGGKFVAARNPEKPVSEMDLTGNYFSERYVCARRFG